MVVAMDCLRDNAASKALLELMLRNADPRGPICVFTKRTHLQARLQMIQSVLYKNDMSKVMRKTKWVRFWERTHYQGVIEG
jgi:hypothetical protein